jgi:phage/conjugal plasmid C-4 type zinc finger TraR family protein
MDAADFAQEREEALRADALAKIAIKPGNDVSKWFCEDCLQSIPHKRREAVPGCTRCVECQERAERGGKV